MKEEGGREGRGEKKKESEVLQWQAKLAKNGKLNHKFKGKIWV